MQHHLSILENLYNTYSSMLYGIALEISPTQKEAEEILTRTFQKIYDQYLTPLRGGHSFFCIKFIKLLLRTAHEQLNPPGQLSNNFKLKQFENTPLLHRLLCEQINIESYCKENKQTRAEVVKTLQAELVLLQKLTKEKKITIIGTK